MGLIARAVVVVVLAVIRRRFRFAVAVGELRQIDPAYHARGVHKVHGHGDPDPHGGLFDDAHGAEREGEVDGHPAVAPREA